MNLGGDIDMYKISDIAKISNVSTRTLRYYDEINLLKPSSISENGYRLYSTAALDKLQQILFYKSLGLSLLEINLTINDKNFNIEKSLESTLIKYKKQRQHIDNVIANLELSLKDMKGEIVMNKEEKFKTLQDFEDFKDEMLRNNEEKYGEEMKANPNQYDREMVKYSQQKVKNTTKEEFAEIEGLRLEIQELLEKHSADETFDPDVAKLVYNKHKNWLMFYWGKYSPETHRGVCDMYIYDERFKKHYDSKVDGCTEYLRNCVYFVTNEDIS